MTDDLLVMRVRKLLAKAEKTDNAHESEAFSAKAAALIAAHRISPAALRAVDAGGRLAVERFALGRGAYVRARLALLSAVAAAHDAEVVFVTGPRGLTALVAGFGEDLEVVRVLYESLHVQAAAQMAAVHRRTPAATQRWRRAFLFGFAARTGELLTAASASASGAAHTAAPGRHPDLLARAKLVHQFAAEAFGRVVAASAPAPAAAGGWRDGHHAAGRADLGRRRLPDRAALGPAPS